MDSWKLSETGKFSRIIEEDGIFTGVLKEKEYFVGTPAAEEAREIDWENSNGIEEDIPKTPKIRLESNRSEEVLDLTMKFAVPPEIEGFSTL